MTKRLATAVAIGATALGAMGLTAPAAMAATTTAAITPALTCGTHQQEVPPTRYSYFGNCADHAVNIHVWYVYIAPGSTIPQDTYEGVRCVPAQTDFFLGTSSTIYNPLGGYAGVEDGTC